MVHIEKLLLVSGHNLALRRATRKFKSCLSSFAREISVISDLREVAGLSLDYHTAVICLCSLEEATPKRMDRL